MSTDLMLFTDGSVDAKSGVGYGAYLALPDADLTRPSLSASVKVMRFQNTSSARLELQTLLWALSDIADFISVADAKLTIYTDSQNIIGLPARRARLERCNYYSAKGKRLNNCELYQQFYRVTENLCCTWGKVIGHQPSHSNDRIQQLFSLVDRASRRALRKFTVAGV